MKPLSIRLQMDSAQAIEAAKQYRAAWEQSSGAALQAIKASIDAQTKLMKEQAEAASQAKAQAQAAAEARRQEAAASNAAAEAIRRQAREQAESLRVAKEQERQARAVAEANRELGRAASQALLASGGMGGLAASFSPLGAAVTVVRGLTSACQDLAAAVDGAAERSKALARSGLDFQGRLGMLAQVTGRPNDKGLATEALQFSARTGLGQDRAPTFLESFEGAAASFGRNMRDGEAGKLRELVGKQVAQLGPSAGPGYADNQSKLAASIMGRQGVGQGTASGVFGEMASVNDILGASAGNAEILSRELLQGGSAAVASGQLDWRQAAALTSSFGNVNAGTSGTYVRAALRTLNRPESDLYQAAGLKEGMGGVEGLQRVLAQMGKAKGQGRDLQAWLRDMGVTEEEGQTALMQLYGQQESGALGQFLGMSAAPIEAGKAERDLESRGQSDVAYQFRKAQAEAESAQVAGKMRNQGREVLEQQAIRNLEGRGRGRSNAAAEASRQADPARWIDWYHGRDDKQAGGRWKAEVESEIARINGTDMTESYGFQDFVGMARMDPLSLAGPWMRRQANTTGPVGIERNVRASERAVEGRGPGGQDPEMVRNNEHLQTIAGTLQSLLSVVQSGGSWNRNYAPTTRPARGPSQ